jgi:hypothetical protein
MEKVNNIFVASSDQVIAANVISSTEISGFDIPVFTTSDWLDFNLITVEQMERRNVHFLYPDYVNLENTTVQQFKEKYLSATHQFPTTFAFAGYDMMFQFGKLLLEKGTFFTRDLKKGQFYPGPTLMGINYKNSQDNTFVPIVKFEHGKLEPVNGPKM